MMRVLCLQILMYVTLTQTSEAQSQVSEGSGVVHTILQKSLHSCHHCLSVCRKVCGVNGVTEAQKFTSCPQDLKNSNFLWHCLPNWYIMVNICLIVLQEAAKGWTEKRSSGCHMMLSAQRPKRITKVPFTNEIASS